MKMSKLVNRLCCAATLCAAVSVVQAQTSRGTVTGAVNDPTNASIPGATVEIKSTETGVVRSTVTNDAGLYRFDAVDIGTYDVNVKAAGFRTYTSRAVPVSAAQIATVNVTVEVGEAASSIEVSSDSIQLQTESPVRGGNLNIAEMTRLPYFSRNPALLAVTLPGVTEQRSNLPGVATFSVNGSRGRANNFLLDGTENNDISVAGEGFQIKNPDAVEEVSVQTSNYDAEFGRAGGGVVNIITKSGTNQFHGTLAWVPDFTNDDAITSTLSSDAGVKARGKLPPGYQQYYNCTIGGPIVREKTFFFASWQEERQRATNTQTFVTLSALGRQQLRAAFPQGSNPRADTYLDVTSGVNATGSLSNIDLGNGRGNVQYGTGTLAYPYSVNGRQTLNKVDHHFSDRDILSFRYAYDNLINPTSIVNFPGFSTSGQQRYQNAVITETHVFSPTFTNEFRLPYNRIVIDSPLDPTDARGTTLLQTNFTGLNAIGIDPRYPQGRVANNFILQDTMSLVRGKHTFRFGLDLLNQRSRQFAPIGSRGVLSYTSSNIAGQPYSAFANYLDDFGGSGGFASRDFGNPAYYPELFRQAYFFQDRWQVGQNFTLTLGLRWEDFGNPLDSLRTPAYAGIFNETIDAATHTVTAPFTQPNKVNSDLNNFSPVVGLTYSPQYRDGILGRIFGDRKSVIRTGYSIGYDTFFNNIASNAQSSSPNLVTTQTVSIVSAENPRGFPKLSEQIPVSARPVSLTDTSMLVVKDLRNPYTQRWSFGIQRELGWGLVLDAAYVGSSGTRLYMQEDLNPVINDPSRRILPAGYSSIAALQAVIPNLQPRLDPLMGDRTTRTNGGHSSYHSGQFELAKRFTADFGFRAAYTWSKLLDNTADVFSFNNSSPNAAIPTPLGGGYLEKAVSLYDRPYRFVLAFNYLLPLFKAQHGVAGRILGGWQLAGITTLESGVPVNVSNGVDADGVGGAGDRPDLNPSGQDNVRARPDKTSPTGYVNPDVLDTNGAPVPINPSDARYVGLSAGAGRTGTAGRNTARTPGIRNQDVNLSKNIRLTERFGLEFRTEFYNVFNHPQYGYPSVSIFAPAGGTPFSNVNGSAAGRFLNYPASLDGGGRVIRYHLTLRF